MKSNNRLILFIVVLLLFFSYFAVYFFKILDLNKRIDYIEQKIIFLERRVENEE